MIAIFSKRDLEFSTEQVIDWLERLGANFIRINGSDMVTSFSSSLAESASFNSFVPEDINICWFRRWTDEEFLPSLAINANSSKYNTLKLHEHLRSEINLINKMFFLKLKRKKWLSSQREISHSKLEVLEAARSCDLRTPMTLITTKKEDLISFFYSHNKLIISKCISDSPFYYSENEFFSLKTVQITEEFLNDTPATFFISLFQELIPKQYELRIFYLDGEFYPMAIFSQLDGQTTIDFRNYNLQKPNRTVPYSLPQDVKTKLQSLMNSLEMTTGSIDMIRSEKGEYIFLEINPIGQFGMTSMPCNYFLEKKIAKYLITNDN